MLRKLLMIGVVALGTLSAAGSLAPAQAWVRAGWHAGWGWHGCCWRGGWGWRAGWWGHPGWGPGWHAAWGWGPGWGRRPGHWVWIGGRGWVWR
jgi:hypothetical protein